jgi:hypothetical protein
LSRGQNRFVLRRVKMHFIEYYLTEEIYEKFIVFDAKKSKTVRKQINLQSSLMPLYLLLMFILDGKLTLFETIYMIIASIIIFPLFKYFGFKEIGRKVKNKAQEYQPSDLLGMKSVVISDVELEVKSENSIAKYNWNAVSRFFIEDEEIYIYINSIDAIIIPIEAIEDYDGLINLLKTKLGF